jgi:hypothetical protein
MDNGTRIAVELSFAGITFASFMDALPAIAAGFAAVYYVAMTIEAVGRMRSKWNKD